METMERTCEHCGGQLPTVHRSDRRYCSNSHRVLAARARKRARDAALASEQAARVPAELASRPRWVRYSSRKVPLRTDGRFAAVNDPSSWSDFATASAATAGEGVGFV